MTRVVAAVTAVVALASVLLQLVLVVAGEPPDLGSGAPPPALGVSLIRFVCYFTIQSNLLIVLGCGWLAGGAAASSTAWRVIRLDGVVGILVTGVVYNTLLAPTLSYAGWAAVANAGLHILTPLLAVLGFLLLEPRGRLTQRVLAWSLLWPAAYVVLTLGHGAASGWYPYPFIDVTALGYPRALRNAVGLVVLIVGVALLARGYDAWRARRSPGVADTRT